MPDVVSLRQPTRINLRVDHVLELAEAAGLTSCVVIGTHPDGSEFFASSYASGPEALWLLAQAQLALLETAKTPPNEE